jgi:hypothetical protein
MQNGGSHKTTVGRVASLIQQLSIVAKNHLAIDFSLGRTRRLLRQRATVLTEIAK